MHEPAPRSAARNDTPTTNFGRMRIVPLSYLIQSGPRQYGPQNAAKDNTASKSHIRKMSYSTQEAAPFIPHH
jgi:hypothetical protein